MATSAQVAVGRMRPKFFPAYRQHREEVYARYLRDRALPEPNTLSAAARKTLSENLGIKYSVAAGLDFTYDKAYPTNVPLLGLLTFGCCWGGTELCIGCGERPELIIRNAKLRAGKQQ
jgi:hypothetical protein